MEGDGARREAIVLTDLEINLLEVIVNVFELAVVDGSIHECGRKRHSVCVYVCV